MKRDFARRPHRSFVYFAQSTMDGKIKIGVTTDVQGRIRRLETMHGSPIKLLGYMEGDRDLERSLHVVFAPFRRLGEWFDAATVILFYIDSMTTLISPTDEVIDGCLMTWEAGACRWRKMHRGVYYVVSCRQLGVPKNKLQSVKAANAWWLKKRRELCN